MSVHCSIRYRHSVLCTTTRSLSCTSLPCQPEVFRALPTIRHRLYLYDRMCQTLTFNAPMSDLTVFYGSIKQKVTIIHAVNQKGVTLTQLTCACVRSDSDSLPFYTTAYAAPLNSLFRILQSFQNEIRHWSLPAASSSIIGQSHNVSS